jgi:hypothetical protein
LTIAPSPEIYAARYAAWSAARYEMRFSKTKTVMYSECDAWSAEPPAWASAFYSTRAMESDAPFSTQAQWLRANAKPNFDD